MQFEDQSYEKEMEDAKLSPAKMSDQLSEQSSIPSVYEKKIDTKINQPAVISPTKENVRDDIQMAPERHHVTESKRAQSSSQSLQKLTTERKSAGRGISGIPAGMPNIVTNGEVDSETYRSLENQMKLCIDPYKTSLRNNPYAITYSLGLIRRDTQAPNQLTEDERIFGRN